MIEKEVLKEQIDTETTKIIDISKEEGTNSVVPPPPPPLDPSKKLPKRPLTTDDEHEKEIKALEYTPTQPTYYHNKPEEKNDTGYSGLSNQGATCYLNSLLQSLYMTPTVRKTLYEWRYNSEKHGTAERSIPYQLQKLFAKMDCSKKKAQKTTDLTTSFGWNRSDSFVQHDVNELCHLLFDAIDKSFYPKLYQYRSAVSKSPQSKDEIKERFKGEQLEDHLLSDKYAGVMIDYLHAKQVTDGEGKPIGRTRFDRYMDIQLVVHDIHDIRDSLKAYIQPETMEGDNQWFCEALGRKVDAVKGIQFKTFPDILTLHLKRFDYDRRTWQPIKLGHKVKFPFELDMSPYLTTMEAYQTKNATPQVYELYSVMIHSGSVNAGHYYAYIKDFMSNNWYEFNDSRVSSVTVEEVKKMYGDDDGSSYHSTNAYMLMYRRKGTCEKITKDEMVNLLPNDILEDIKNENASFEEKAKAYVKQQSMMRLNVYYKPHITNEVIKIETIESPTDSSSSDSDDDEQVSLGNMFETGPSMNNYGYHHNVLNQCEKTPFHVEKDLTLGDFMKKVNSTISQHAYWGGHALEDVRLREADRDTLGRCFDGSEAQPLKNLSLSEWTPLVLQTKNPGEDWPVEHRSIPLHVEFFSSKDEKNMPYQSFDANPDDTLSSLKNLILEERPTFAQEEDGFLLLTKREYKLEKSIELRHKDDDLLERDLKIEEHDRFIAEWVSDEDAPSKALTFLRWKEESIGVNFSHPDDPKTYDQHLRIDKKKYVHDLKAAIAEALQLENDTLRLWSNTRSKVFRESDLAKPLSSCYMVYENCSLRTDIGEPLSSNDFMLDVHYYDSKEALHARLRDAKERNQKFVSEGSSTRINPTVEFRNRYNLSRYFSNQEFTKIDTFPVSSTQPLRQFRELLSEHLQVPSNELRIRLKKSNIFEAGQVLYDDDAPIGSQVSLSERTVFCVSHVINPLPFTKGDILLTIYPWNRGKWKLGEPFEFVFHAQEDDSLTSFKKQLLASNNGIDYDFDDLGATTAPYGFNRFHNKACSITAERPFDNDVEHLLAEPIKLSDGDIMLYCDLRIPKRKVPDVVLKPPTTTYSSSSSSSYREPSLKISTEFDEDLSSTPSSSSSSSNADSAKIY